jgi:hypothetical protein
MQEGDVIATSLTDRLRTAAQLLDGGRHLPASEREHRIEAALSVVAGVAAELRQALTGARLLASQRETIAAPPDVHAVADTQPPEAP